MALLRCNSMSPFCQKYERLLRRLATILIAVGAGVGLLKGSVISSILLVIVGVLLHFFISHNIDPEKQKDYRSYGLTYIFEDVIVTFFAVGIAAIFFMDIRLAMALIAVSIALYFIFLYYKKVYEFSNEDSHEGKR